MLLVEDVSFKYSRQRDFAIRKLSFTCESGGITTIVGRSGIGKSTLIALIAGIYHRSDPMVATFLGRILINGNAAHDLRGPAAVSWVPQEPVLLDYLSVLDNVLLPLSIGGVTDLDRSRGQTLLRDLGIEKHADDRPRSLSGGEKTRVSLARALVSTPCCLFLDEPFVGLDLMTRWGIYKVLKSVRKGLDLTTIMTSHNIPEAIVLSDRIVVIQDSEDGTVAEVIDISDDLAIDDPIACLQAARDIGAPIERKILLCDY